MLCIIIKQEGTLIKCIRMNSLHVVKCSETQTRGVSLDVGTTGRANMYGKYNSCRL